MISTLQYLRFGLDHLDLIEDLSNAGSALIAVPASAPDRFVQSWEILKPAGDRLAPVADELVALLNKPREVEPALTGELLEKEEQETADLVLKALVKRARHRDLGPRQRDRKWLELGLQALQILLPVLLSQLGK